MTASTHPTSLDLADLEPGSAVDALGQSLEALMAASDPAIFIETAPTEDLHARAVFLDSSADELPLRGLTFAVKDNIDVAGFSTTCACPEYAYVAEHSATVVTRLEAAGALCIGKTNMDQFATGLVGTRSPHGTPKNPVDVTLVPGGSSSGSAVAVARGIVDFALGTDTAGSGRVPAAMCGIVGVKPTVGRVPASGVVPAVRSIDCVSLFTDSLALAKALLPIASGRDEADAFSRRNPNMPVMTPQRLGVVDRVTLERAGADATVMDAYGQTVAALQAAGAELVPFDLVPFLAVGDLLYGGPWVAERTAAVGDFVAAHPDDVDPVVGPIIMGGERYSAVDAHLATYRLRALASGPVADELDRFDAFVLPTIPFGPSRADVEADPVGVNSAVGRFTTFVNLLDLCALAVPTPFAPAPVGITFLAPAWHDEALLDLASGLAAGDLSQPAATATPVALAVAGAHLRGQPLASQLEDLGAVWAETTSTAPSYRMYALADGPPFKPALVHDPEGMSLEVDIWQVDDAMLGSFLQMIPAPLALGQVELVDGRSVVGFVSEPRAVDGATEITDHGGWRNYVASHSASASGV